MCIRDRGRTDQAAGNTILHVYDFLRALPDYDRRLDEDVYKRQLLRGADMTENLTILAKTGLCALTEPQVCACLLYTSRCV